MPDCTQGQEYSRRRGTRRGHRRPNGTGKGNEEKEKEYEEEACQGRAVSPGTLGDSICELRCARTPPPAVLPPVAVATVARDPAQQPAALPSGDSVKIWPVRFPSPVAPASWRGLMAGVEASRPKVLVSEPCLGPQGGEQRVRDSQGRWTNQPSREQGETTRSEGAVRKK